VRRLLVLIAFACSSKEPPAPPIESKPVRGTIVADSTIRRADYVGPAACAECHVEQHAAWQASLHSTMNQRASKAAILGAPATLVYASGSMTFDGTTMTVASGDHRVRYQVTRTIGTRGLQEYVGIAEGKTEEVRLPFAWWPRPGGWYPQPYFDPWLEETAFDAYAEVTEPWATRCPWCHSTYPFEQRIARSANGVGHGLEQFFQLPGGSDRLQLGEQVTIGISCESCHLGGRAHAAGAPIHLVPIGATARDGAPKPTTFAAERADPAIVNRVCAQCHSGPSPHFPDGSSSRNSSEALDLATSACTARCVDCHDPHRADARLDEQRSLAACTKCHDQRVGPGHAGKGHDQVSCLDCHMPKVVMGIDRHVRTHRIGSPSDRRMLGAAGPNACNLCHLDRPIQWTTDELRTQYSVGRLDPSRWDYRDSVGETWLASKEPAVRLIAAAAYARSPLGRGMLPELITMLDDPLAYVRVWAQFAIEDILGRKLTEYDPRAPAERRRQQLAVLRRATSVRRPRRSLRSPRGARSACAASAAHATRRTRSRVD
jgi:hypothetical protein